MNRRIDGPWTPFRPTPEELETLEEDVSEIPAIQRTLVHAHDQLQRPDRVAHQYQIAAGPVRLSVAEELPGELEGVGLFEPGAQHRGIGRVSTGLGTPHVEPGLDFLGLMLAFLAPSGRRVDFLAINHPASPTCTHAEFMDVLHATGESADARVPLLGDLGDRDLGDLALEQAEFVLALRRRMGLAAALKTVRHLVSQTLRTFHSSSAVQPYWTGVVEIGGTAGKFTLIPDGPGVPDGSSGERRLTEDWRTRQAAGDVAFDLLWIPYLDETRTPTAELTEPWKEEHRRPVGQAVFPRSDPASEDARLWADLATEMGVNPGNWIRDRDDTVPEPGTRFGAARRIAYGLSQAGRDALDPARYEEVFRTGRIGEELARELALRVQAKRRIGHVDRAPAE